MKKEKMKKEKMKKETSELTLSEWQHEFLVERFDDPLVICCCAVSSGKTRALAYWIVLQAIKYPKSRAIMIAQNFRALSLVLTREIELVCNMFGVSYELNKTNYTLRFQNESIIYGFSAENPSAILGLSNIDILVIDEASYILDVTVYNNAKDRMRGSLYSPKTRLISSPNNSDMSNWFINLVKENKSNVITATIFQNPFISKEFKKEISERYVVGSNIYKQQVLGKILDVSSDSIVNLQDFNYTQIGNEAPFYMGVDVSGGVGLDNTCIVVRNEQQILYIEKWNNLKTIDIVAKIKDVLLKFDCEAVFIDNTGGYGSGVIDLLQITNKNIIPINFAERAIDVVYKNIKSEMFADMSKAIKNGFNIGFENKDLLEEIRAHRCFIDNTGKWALKSKDLVKTILGHSPDLADALALSFCKKNYELESVVDIDNLMSNLDIF